MMDQMGLGQRPAGRDADTGDVCVLEVEDLSKSFRVRGKSGRGRSQEVHAVNNVSLKLSRGETLGLVGESGSGKSTLARLIMGLVEPTQGEISFEDEGVSGLSRKSATSHRRRMQMVFQDPYSSFDPLSSLENSLSEPLRVHLSLTRQEVHERVGKGLERVGLHKQFLLRYPGELSGGQLQRAAIARALALEPTLLILDEPVSALDVSTQAQIINLLQDLQDELSTTYLFIAHDLSIVRHISDRIAVMYLGKVIEEGLAEDVYCSPSHPYTQALISAVPVPDPIQQRSRSRIVLTGGLPSPLDLPNGCHFHTRCPNVMPICSKIEPAGVPVGDSSVYCHLYGPGQDALPLLGAVDLM